MKYQRILFSLIQRAVRDPEFLSAWQRVVDAETAFLPIREGLPEEQDQIVDEYLFSRELLTLLEKTPSGLHRRAQTVKEVHFSHWRGSALGFPRGEAVAAVRR